jgi:phage repressor protein C with HTH and peptisase S24 domain
MVGEKMFTHKDIWLAIDALAARSGLSPSALARAAGLDPTAFNVSRRCSDTGKPRWPSTETVAKILQATGVAFRDFALLLQAAPEADDPSAQPVALLEALVRPACNPCCQRINTVIMPDNSMEPAYRQGDRLVLWRHAPLRQGDRVVLKMKDSQVVAREFRHHTRRDFELAFFHPQPDLHTIGKHKVDWVARIIWASQ